MPGAARGRRHSLRAPLVRSDGEGLAAAAARPAGGGVEVASELSGEGGHFSAFPAPLLSPPPLVSPSLLPAPHVRRNIKGGVRLEGRVNGEGLRGCPLWVPARPVHPRSSSLPEARPRRQERPAPAAEEEEEEKEGSRRAERRARFPPQRLEYKDYRAEGNCTRLLRPPYPTQCISRLSPPRPRPLQT